MHRRRLGGPGREVAIGRWWVVAAITLFMLLPTAVVAPWGTHATLASPLAQVGESCGLASPGLVGIGNTEPCTRGTTLPYSGVVTVPIGSNKSSFDWPELHRDPALSGWLANTTLSAQNAGSLGVAWATDLYGPALDSP